MYNYKEHALCIDHIEIISDFEASKAMDYKSRYSDILKYPKKHHSMSTLQSFHVDIWTSSAIREIL